MGAFSYKERSDESSIYLVGDAGKRCEKTSVVESLANKFKAPMIKNVNWWIRKTHRWLAVIFAIPMLLVIISGLMLQVKKQFAWIQPPTQRSETGNVTPDQTWEQILNVARNVPEADVESWGDVDRLDVRPSRGIVKVRCENRWEIQIDLHTGKLLSSTLRRSDLIESLHDGSFFTDSAKLWIFLPNGLALLVLWLSGLWLWYLPHRAKRRKKHM